MNNLLTDTQAAVTDKELDHLIWGIERYGLYPRQLAALKELREWRRAVAVPVAWLAGDVTLYNPDTVEVAA
ncbi:MAG: hypothetical protein ACRCZ6_17080 [Kluyvera sp.]|uniref:hypothetical protein n=1 Tax=Kluyvera sp. TaxID=1538228 RepID=UPI003F393FF6